MKKILFLSVLLTYLLWSSISYAKDDCEDIDANGSFLSEFLPAEDLEVARSHLLAYCCNEKPTLPALQGKCTGDLIPGAESPYRYDHLVDIGLRRLDARTQDLYPGMTADTDGVAWNKFITSTDSKNPELIKKAYEKYWSFLKPILPSDYNRSDYYMSLTNTNFKELSFTLRDKYINYCFLAMAMYYNRLNLYNIDIVQDGYYNRCDMVAKNRIKQETSLATSLSQYSAATMLVDSANAYAKEFVQNRLMKLFDKIVAISSLFTTLEKQAPLSAECTK